MGIMREYKAYGKKMSDKTFMKSAGFTYQAKFCAICSYRKSMVIGENPTRETYVCTNRYVEADIKKKLGRELVSSFTADERLKYFRVCMTDVCARYIRRYRYAR